MSSPRRLSMGEVEALVEPGTFQRGMETLDRGFVTRSERWKGGLQAQVDQHQVRVEIQNQVTASCSCRASRRTPYCPHAAAVLVAWVREPESFQVVAEATRLSTVRRGKADPAPGLIALQRLLEEFAEAGLATITEERLQEVRDLSKRLRACGLSRLSSKLTLLHALLQDRSRFSVEEYVHQLADLTAAAKIVEALLSGRLQDDRAMDEFLGKSWASEALPIRRNLSLVELLFERVTTPDGFRVEMNYFADLTGGEIGTKKRIFRSSNRARTGRSYAGLRLEVGEALEMPGFPPIRWRWTSFEERTATEEDHLRLISWACVSVEELLARVRDARREALAPDRGYYLFKAEGLWSRQGRLFLLDTFDAALPLECQDLALRRLDPLFTQPCAVFLRTAQNGGEILGRPLSAVTPHLGVIAI